MLELPTPELLDGGLWRIPLPMPFGPPTINVYLVACPGGWLMVDTGLDIPESWDALTGTLAELGVDPSQLRHIITTHLHSDHCGQAARLRDLSGAQVWMHRADADLLMNLKTSEEHFEALSALLEREGAATESIPSVLNSYRRLLATFPALSPDGYLEEGQVFETFAGPLMVMHLPGHSPGLCALSGPGFLISSDHVLEDTHPHVGWLPGYDTLGDYLGTLDRLAELDGARILPAHGNTFEGLAAWAEEERNHRTGRAAEIRAYREEGLTLGDDLVRRLWRRELRPLDYQLAMTEVEAFAEHERRFREQAG